MTIRESGFLVWEYYRNRLNAYEKKALGNMLDGIRGLHTEENPLTDERVKDFLSERQINFIKKLAKRFRITKKI